MTAFGDNPALHVIRDGSFVCTAPDDAPCRTYPTCDCESWCWCDSGDSECLPGNEGKGHCCADTTKPGQPCWMSDHIWGSGLADSYDADAEWPEWDEEADERVWPNGSVTCEWHGDYLTWRYAPLAGPLPESAAQG